MSDVKWDFESGCMWWTRGPGYALRITELCDGCIVGGTYRGLMVSGPSGVELEEAKEWCETLIQEDINQR